MRTNNPIKNIILKIGRIPFFISLITIITIIYDLGFNQSDYIQLVIKRIYLLTLFIAIISSVIRDIFVKENLKLKVLIVDVFYLLILTFLLAINLNLIHTSYFIAFFLHPFFLHAAMLLIFIREFSALNIDLKKTEFNPAQIFIISFLIIIVIGTFLLKLPNATHQGISLINALFTSTSAVCVTGLVVVDTGTCFTDFGLTIITILIQIGGLGIMTFSSYFSYFFRGGSSYRNHLMISDMSNIEKIGEVFSTLKKIILVTFTIEVIGAILIFFNLNQNMMPLFIDRLNFSIFHSISGFCNAGFSTLSNSFYETGFRFNYPIQLILSSIIIIGGLGFPIVFNISKYLKHLFLNRILVFNNKSEIKHVPWVINLNSRIVLITTFILLIFGTFFFFFFEYNNSLTEHNFVGKIITAFFESVTTRTAGFNTVDISSLRTPTLLIIILLMWIGASPGSTGGGIKTSTFALAFMNFISLAKGKNRIEVYRREIADVSIHRAFAIITLSLLVIGISIITISFIENDKDLLSIAFECFSAYSTVGLSMGITANLSVYSKVVIIMVMFIGRVSTLSILIAILKRARHKNYRYPSEEILIN